MSEVDKCSVCMEKLGDYMVIPCGHKLHYGCLRTMFFMHRDNKCPLCRTKFLYPINRKNRKAMKKLKIDIIAHYSNEYGRMYCRDIMQLAHFLYHNDSELTFINKMATVIDQNHRIEGFIRWAIKDNNAIILFPDGADGSQGDCACCCGDINGDRHELPCGHIYHHNCIKELFIVDMKDRCLICDEKFIYYPSRKRKARQALRKKILAKYCNKCDRMPRQEICDLGHYLSSRRVHIQFIAKMVGCFQDAGCDELGYAEYTQEYTFLYEKNCRSKDIDGRCIGYANEE